MDWRTWGSDVAAVITGLALAFVTLYVLGALLAGVRMTMCEDQCQADRLAAAGQQL